MNQTLSGVFTNRTSSNVSSNWTRPGVNTSQVSSEFTYRFIVPWWDFCTCKLCTNSLRLCNDTDQFVAVNLWNTFHPATCTCTGFFAFKSYDLPKHETCEIGLARIYLFFLRKRHIFACIFVSFARIVAVALVSWRVLLRFCEYLDRPPEFDVRVQGGSGEYIVNKLNRHFPDKVVNRSEFRRGRQFVVLLTVTGTRMTYKREVVSMVSYTDAWISCIKGLPSRHSIQGGLLSMIGVKETPVVKFVKSLALFVYDYYAAGRSRSMQVFALVRWLDTIIDLAPRLGFQDKIDYLFSCLTRSDAIVSHLNEYKDVGNNIREFMAVEPDGSLREMVDRINGRKPQPCEPSQLDKENVAAHNIDDVFVVQSLTDVIALCNSFLRGVFVSSSIKAVVKLITLVWHVLFVFKAGKLDFQHLIEWEKANPIPDGVLSMGNFILEQLNILGTCAVEFYSTRDINVFLRNDTEITKFHEVAEVLAGQVAAHPVTEVLDIRLQDLERRIEAHIALGESLRPKVKMALRSNFTSALVTLRHMRATVSMMGRASTNRLAPYTLLIHGPPKIGKSSINNMITAQFRAHNAYNTIKGNGLTLDPSGVYTRTLKEEYWSAYMNSNWCIIYDDLGQTNPKVPEFALEINEIIQVVNNVAFFPNMADVNDKGKRYVAPQLVIATTNNKDLNAVHAVRSAGAVLRRFPFVICPKVRDEYKTDNALDPAKANGHFDLWLFTIEKVKLNEAGNVSYEEIHSGMSTPDFLAWIRRTSEEFFRGQLANDTFTESVKRSPVCSTCGVLSVFCAHIQFRAAAFYLFGRVTSFFSWFFAIMLIQYIGIQTFYWLHFFLTLLEDPARWIPAMVLAVTGFLDRVAFRTCRSFVCTDPVDIEVLRNLRYHYLALSATQRAVSGAIVRLRQHSTIIIAVLAALASAGFLMYYYTLVSKFDVQGVPGEVLPPPDANLPNTWKDSKPPTFTSFLSSQSTTGTIENFKKLLEEATGLIEVGTHSIRTINVFGRYWLVPRHFASTCMKQGVVQVRLLRSGSFRDGNSNFGSAVFLLDKSKMIWSDDEDFVLCEFPIPPGKNLLPYCSRIPLRKSFTGSATFIREGEGLAYFPTSVADSVMGICPALSELNGWAAEHPHHLHFYKVMVKTENGDCGSPLIIAEQGRCVIVGVHVGESSNDSTNKLAVSLPMEWLNNQFRSLDKCVLQSTMNVRKANGSQFEITDLHKKCPIRFPGVSDSPDGSSILPLGTIVGLAGNRFCSAVAENLYASFWRANGYVCEKMRPVLNGVYCESWLPKRNFILNATTHKDLMDPDKLRVCADHYRNRLNRIPEKSRKNLRVLTDDAVMYGEPNNSFVSHMCFNTGAGFPYNLPKSKVLDKHADPRFPNGTYAIPPGMKTRIDEMEETLSRGERVNFVFNSSLKDEPISEKKLRMGKLRVFQAIPIEGLYLLRKFFLSVIALFQTWNFVSEAAIGMDATGPDWDDIHEYCNPPGWKRFCGDYSNYDQRMGSSIMMLAWEVLIDLCKVSGHFSTAALRVMIGLATECCYVTVNFFGDLFILNGTNPSGHALTVVINSICNSIYVRYAWLETFGNLDDFDDNVRVLTYGDDNIVSVSPKYQDRFNQNVMTIALAKVGVVYTDAQKSGGEVKPFCDPSEESFLKRGFVWDQENSWWSSPLEMASIHKMLIIGINSNAVQEGDRLADVLMSSVQEAFQHGREFFTAHRELAIECMHQFNLQGWVAAKGGMPTYERFVAARKAKISRKGLLEQVLTQNSTS